MHTDHTRIKVTRAIPSRIRIDNASVEILGDDLAPRDALLRFVPGAHALVTMYTDSVDDQLLDRAGPQLKVVSNFAVGHDNIDLQACKSRGIAVTNTPDAVTEGTANLAFLLILSVARRLVEADHYARSERYPQGGPLGMADFLGLDLCNKQLLIVGAGRIGYATALRAKAFGMRIAYVARSRHIDFEMSPLGAKRVDLDDGLASADVVSIHTPLSKSTRHLMSDERLRLMKPDAILVNTARGPVVDEAALVRALQEERLWGAGLDVFEHEPAVHPGLIDSDRVVLTPHIGSAEIRWREAMTEMVQNNIRAVLEGKEPPNRIA
jgi:glyoxylate reductase